MGWVVDGGPHHNTATGKSLKVRITLAHCNRKQVRRGGSCKLILEAANPFFSLCLASNCQAWEYGSISARSALSLELQTSHKFLYYFPFKIKNQNQAQPGPPHLTLSSRFLPLPESMVLSVVLQGNSFHLGTPVCHEPGQFLSRILCLFVVWGWNFKQAVSTGPNSHKQQSKPICSKNPKSRIRAKGRL